LAGIYLHIPFCRQKCHYCNFYSLASFKYKDEFLKALHTEIILQKGYLANEPVETIYLGGGTPSLLSRTELDTIFNALYKYFNIVPDAEITLEANPDDLEKSKIRELGNSPVNRLSIGIQSFFNDDLKYLNRVHNAEQAKTCIHVAKDAGFEDLTIDLIYGIPTLTGEKWQKNLEIFTGFNLLHLSAYALTVEPHTPLDILIRKHKMKPVEDERIVNHFNQLMDFASAHNYLHYEISNFCRDYHFSKHNTGYWLGKKYLGLGPSAHSFNGDSRQWNISNVMKYAGSLDEGILPAEKEILSINQKYNEFIMVSIRTIWGVDISALNQRFDMDIADHFLKQIETFILSGQVIKEGENYSLTRAGKFFADRIAANLFL